MNNQNADADLYSFTGNAGELLYLHSIQYRQQQLDTICTKRTVIGSNSIYNYDDELTLSITGQYLLVMQGAGYNTNSYGSAYNNFELDLYPQHPTQSLPLNQVASGNISYPGENDTYTFNGTIGQQMFYDALVGGNPNLTMRLYAPSGQQIYYGLVQNDIGPDNLIFTETGQYSLVINGNGAATGAYSFRFLNENDAPGLSFNTIYSGTFGANKLDADIYTFMGTTGKQIAIQNINDSSSDFWILYGPGGVQVGSNNLATNQNFTLSINGQYALVMQGRGYDSNYTFEVADLGNNPSSNITTTPLALNQVINGNITATNNSITYTFQGISEQQLYYDVLNSNGALVKLYAPSGRQIYLYSGTPPYNVGPDTLLTETGTYSLVVSGGIYRYLQLSIIR